MALSDTQIRALKSAASASKHSDGGGLHLLVSPKGSKLWRLAYRYEGKQKTLALGVYPAVSLADARQKRENAKKLLASGVDPSQQAKLDKIAKRALRANTFDRLADEFLAKLEREGKAEATMTKKRWLLDLARGDLGERPVSEISATEILVPLRRTEAAGNYETARRMRATIGQVFRYAISTSRAENDPTFGLRGALTAPTVRHRPALTDKTAFGGFIRAVWEYSGAPETRAALQLMTLLYPRPGELRMAEWAEFDLDGKVWTIPARRTKMRREHRKPLSVAAVEVLRDLFKLSGHRRLAFPSIQSPLRPLSENTLNAALRRLGFTKAEATAHGFRAAPKSVDQALAAIAQFETSTGYKDFAAFHIEQARRFKRILAEEVNTATGKPLATATVYSRLKVVRAFFVWLAGQPGYRSRLRYSDADYFNLSANEGRIATAMREQKAPSLEQIRHVLAAMPAGTSIERRDRALVAFILLTGARDDAVASLSVRHVDLDRQLLDQDARTVRTKNRKTFPTWFFPVGEEVEQVVRDWIHHLKTELHFGPDEPLFPATRITLNADQRFTPSGLDRRHWSHAGPIRRVFRDAFARAGLPYYHPHTFRRTLARLAGEGRTNVRERLQAAAINRARIGFSDCMHEPLEGTPSCTVTLSWLARLAGRQVDADLTSVVIRSCGPSRSIRSTTTCMSGGTTFGYLS